MKLQATSVNIQNVPRSLILLGIVCFVSLIEPTSARAQDAPPPRQPKFAPPGQGGPGPNAFPRPGFQHQFQPIDPATGLPVPPVPWKDPDWPDPGHVLTEVRFDALPVSEVAPYLQKEFKNAFDILVPNNWQNRGNLAPIDPSSATVRLELRNVSASEIFNAMNLMFEAENSPYRWELRMNGNRPVAILRVMPGLLPPQPPIPTPPTSRSVQFVGDLLGDERGFSGGTAMEQLVRTVSDIYRKGMGDPEGVIQFHKESQLLIVTGSPDQISFVQSTLAALREKARFNQVQPKGFGRFGDPKAKPEESKPSRPEKE